MLSPEQEVPDNDPLITESLKLLEDLPIIAANERFYITEPRYYEENGFMLLPRLPQADEILTRNFIKQWTNIMISGASERLFNREFNKFTEERKQFRPLLDPEYTKKITSKSMSIVQEKLEEHILQILPDQAKSSLLYPSFLYSSANGEPQVPHSDLSIFTHPDEEFLLLVALHGVTTIIVFPRSHVPAPKSRYRYCPLRLSLEPGEILRFHPKLLHSGDKYSENNLRLHYYVLKSLDSLKNSTTKPLRRQLLLLVSPVNLKVAHACHEGRQKKRNRIENITSKRSKSLRKGFHAFGTFQSSLYSKPRYEDANTELDEPETNNGDEDPTSTNILHVNKISSPTENAKSSHVTFNKYGPVPDIENLAIHPREHIQGMVPDNRFQNYVRFEDNALFPIGDCILIGGRYYLRRCSPMKYMLDVSELSESTILNV